MSKLFDDASLAMIPSAYKDGKLYSIRPTDGSGDFTFSRGSNLAATRVDVNGLIEKGRENLVLQSNQFDTTWISNNTSETSGQSGYDGSSDAWLLDISGGISSQYIGQNISLSGVQTFSFYAKAGSKNWVMCLGTGASFPQVYFDLQNGVVGTESLATGAIVSVGNGWYRCSMWHDIAIGSVRIYIATADNDINQSSGSIYIQDAQLEQGLVATDYIETGASTAQAGILEDMPRLDYSGGASCPSLLLEPQRTNGVTHSEYLGSWSTSNATQSFGSTSPEGLNNAYSYATSSVNGSTSTSVSVPNDSNTHIMSVFVKNVSGYSSIRLRGAIVGGAEANSYSIFDLSNGTRTYTTQDGGIEDYGNGWYRIWNAVTNNSSGNTSLAFQVFLTNDSAQTNVMEVYGAQAELNVSYPTSYIPTYGTSQTRNGDYCYRSGISDLIGQTQGTLFFDWTMIHESPNTSEDLYTLTMSDGTGNKLIGVNNYNNTLAVFIKDTTTQFFDNSYTSGADGARIKLALAYANNDVALYINGTQIATDSSATIPTLNTIRFNTFWNGNLPDISSVNQLLLFKTRLTNAELAALTTL